MTTHVQNVISQLQNARTCNVQEELQRMESQLLQLRQQEYPDAREVRRLMQAIPEKQRSLKEVNNRGLAQRRIDTIRHLLCYDMSSAPWPNQIEGLKIKVKGSAKSGWVAHTLEFTRYEEDEEWWGSVLEAYARDLHEAGFIGYLVEREENFAILISLRDFSVEEYKETYEEQWSAFGKKWKYKKAVPLCDL